MWVCDLALLTDGRWVHVSRLKDILGDTDKTGKKIELVARLNEPV
jgi:hypothetical protein